MVALLTDLQDQWYFFWLSIDRQVCWLQITDLSSGVTTLKEIIESSSGARQLRLPLSCVSSPHGPRCQTQAVKIFDMESGFERMAVCALPDTAALPEPFFSEPSSAAAASPPVKGTSHAAARGEAKPARWWAKGSVCGAQEKLGCRVSRGEP